jgi:ring-1,2-phenylacetyl-CoA epoxidase subunit PaaC
VDTNKFEYLLRQGDNALILSQQLSQLCGKGPALEEDMALTNVALDLLGQTRMWLGYAGELEGHGRDEDRLAYLRDAANSATCCWSNSRTATTRRPWCASSSSIPGTTS